MLLKYISFRSTTSLWQNEIFYVLCATVMYLVTLNEKKEEKNNNRNDLHPVLFSLRLLLNYKLQRENCTLNFTIKFFNTKYQTSKMCMCNVYVYNRYISASPYGIYQFSFRYIYLLYVCVYYSYSIYAVCNRKKYFVYKLHTESKLYVPM